MPRRKKSYLELTFAAKDGTKLAKQVAENTDLKTNYAAFRLPEAAVALSCGAESCRPKRSRKISPR